MSCYLRKLMEMSFCEKKKRAKQNTEKQRKGLARSAWGGAKKKHACGDEEKRRSSHIHAIGLIEIWDPLFLYSLFFSSTQKTCHTYYQC